MSKSFGISAEMKMDAHWWVEADSYEEALAKIFDEEHPKYDHEDYQDGFSWHLHQLTPDMDTVKLFEKDGIKVS